MALQIDVNSYVTVAQADEYFTDRVNADAWHSSDHRDGALVTATTLINLLEFRGELDDLEQPLLFPRIGEYYDTSRNVYIDLNTDYVRGLIDKATMELAFHLITNPDVLNDTTTSGSLGVGALNLSFIRKAPTINGIVNRFLKDVINNGPGTRSVMVGG